jgi:hypothetical protein
MWTCAAGLGAMSPAVQLRCNGPLSNGTRDMAMTPIGQLPFFVDFLKTSSPFDAFELDCLLCYQCLITPQEVRGVRVLS